MTVIWLDRQPFSNDAKLALSLVINTLAVSKDGVHTYHYRKKKYIHKQTYTHTHTYSKLKIENI